MVKNYNNLKKNINNKILILIGFIPLYIIHTMKIEK